MFKEISWNSYWTFIAIAVVVYYLLLVVMFRVKGSFVMPVSTKGIWHKQEQAPTSSDKLPFEPTQHVDADFLNPEPESDEYAVYACVDEVNAYLEEACKTKGDKETIIINLKQIVSKYPSLIETEYKGSLSNVIVAQCAHLCFVNLTDADMNRVWNR